MRSHGCKLPGAIWRFSRRVGVALRDGGVAAVTERLRLVAETDAGAPLPPVMGAPHAGETREASHDRAETRAAPMRGV